MEKFKTLADALALAEFAHRNQVDKAGLSYIEHPKRVLEKVKAQGALPYVQMAAILHDVTEDTAFTPDMLLDLGIPEPAVEIIKLVDRAESKKVYWRDYVGYGDAPDKDGFQSRVDDFYYNAIKQNPGAVQVKLADIEDNLSPWRLAYLSDETQKRLRAKYQKALDILNPRPVNHGLITNTPFDPFYPGGYR